LPSTSFPTLRPSFSLQPSFQPSSSLSPTNTCSGIFPSGTDKILVDRDFNNGSTAGASSFDQGGITATTTTTITSYDQGYDGTTAISMTYSGTPGNILPAVRFGVPNSNACINPGTTIGISFKAKLLNVTDNSEMSCFPLDDASCPEARLRIRNDNIGGNVPAQWNDNLPLGFSSWDPVSSSSSNWIAS